MYTFPELGHFDVAITDDEWNFEFHPIKFSLNNYFVSSFSFAFEPTATGAGLTSFGDIIHYQSQEEMCQLEPQQMLSLLEQVSGH